MIKSLQRPGGCSYGGVLRMPLFMDVHNLGDGVSMDDVARHTRPTWLLRASMTSVTCATGWMRARGRFSAWSRHRMPRLRPRFTAGPTAWWRMPSIRCRKVPDAGTAPLTRGAPSGSVRPGRRAAVDAPNRSGADRRAAARSTGAISSGHAPARAGTGVARCRGYLTDATAGHGRLVFVAGEAGVGKTSFVTRVIAMLAPRRQPRWHL